VNLISSVETSSKSVALMLLTTLALGASPALPQTSTIAELAAYQGADRTQRLIAGAKKEKVVSVYGSTVAEDMRPVSDAFRKRYGIDFQYWRASSEQLVQRAVNENRAGRCAVDAFATVAAELETLHREKLLIAVKTSATADLAPLAFRPHGEWVATRLNIFSASYNTNLVKRDEVPRS
jgi:iron(III) transport system substrate-binding protein